MSCCGKKREALRQRKMTRRVVTPLQTPTTSEQSGTAIVFMGTGSYLIMGQHSRHVYHFSQEQPEQHVDAQDAAAMAQTGLFQIRR